jgi:signal transduction histidine kinase
VSAPAPPEVPPDQRWALLCEELARPLAAARADFEALGGAAAAADGPARPVLEAIEEVEAMMAAVLALSFDIAPALQRQPVDLRAECARAVAAYHEQPLARPRVELRLEGDLTGRWNAWACRRVLHDLLAVALSLTDGPLMISAARAGAQVTVEIEVIGVPMSSPAGRALLDELGERPRQLHLWLAARLAEAHGGQLRAAPDAAGWITLTVVLPDPDPRASTPEGG